MLQTGLRTVLRGLRNLFIPARVRAFTPSLKEPPTFLCLVFAELCEPDPPELPRQVELTWAMRGQTSHCDMTYHCWPTCSTPTTNVETDRVLLADAGSVRCCAKQPPSDQRGPRHLTPHPPAAPLRVRSCFRRSSRFKRRSFTSRSTYPALSSLLFLTPEPRTPLRPFVAQFTRLSGSLRPFSSLLFFRPVL